MALPNPNGEHGIGRLTDQTIDTRITNGPRPYLAVAVGTTDDSTTTTTKDITSVTATFTAPERHLIKYTLMTHFVSSVAGDTVRFKLTNSSGTLEGAPSAFDAVVAAANVADSKCFVAYEIFTTTQLVTRKWRFVRASGTGTVHAFADSATGREHLFLVEDLGVILPT